jgi:uncharacterized membrane protein YhaH (DUF805 family)
MLIGCHLKSSGNPRWTPTQDKLKGWIIICQLRTDEEKWYWQLNLGSRFTIVLLFRIQKMAKPSAVFNTTNIVHMTSSVSQRLQIVCVLFKMIVFCVIALFAWLYVIVGILCTCGKHLHDTSVRNWQIIIQPFLDTTQLIETTLWQKSKIATNTVQMIYWWSGASLD